MLQLWNDCSRLLASELTPEQFSAWIKPLKAIDYNAATGRLRIGAPNRHKLDLVRKQFAARIQQAAADVLKRPVSVEFEIEAHQAAPASSPTNGDAVTSPLTATTTPIRTGPSEIERARLNGVLTFDTFVNGKANQLARAAAMQVAENPGGSYNPLFLYGGVGLGKTHLIHAVGNGILARKPNAKVRYIHAEQYVSDVVRAYQKKAFDDFKRYYHSLDLLLIDDIQFFCGKSRTQEEFFYAFNALIESRKQVVITCDTYPREIAGMENRLISRFGWGLTVAVEPPELEMRVAILLKKAELENITLDQSVAFFIASHSQTNVRELEGALKRILAYSRFSGLPISIDLCRD